MEINPDNLSQNCMLVGYTIGFGVADDHEQEIIDTHINNIFKKLEEKFGNDELCVFIHRNNFIFIGRKTYDSIDYNHLLRMFEESTTYFDAVRSLVPEGVKVVKEITNEFNEC
jgi:hypothetical protein